MGHAVRCASGMCMCLSVSLCLGCLFLMSHCLQGGAQVQLDACRVMDSKKIPILIQVCEEFTFGVLKIQNCVAALKCHFSLLIWKRRFLLLIVCFVQFGSVSCGAGGGVVVIFKIGDDLRQDNVSLCRFPQLNATIPCMRRFSDVLIFAGDDEIVRNVCSSVAGSGTRPQVEALCLHVHHRQ